MYSLSADEEKKKSTEHRLSRIYGHLGAVQRMAEEKRDCEEILIQLLAVRSALNNLGKVLLGDYMENGMPEDLISGNQDEIRKLEDAVEHFILS